MKQKQDTNTQTIELSRTHYEGPIPPAAEVERFEAIKNRLRRTSNGNGREGTDQTPQPKRQRIGVD